MKYYIKKLGRNELGIKSDGGIARGRFIYVTKSYGQFFPFLSTTVKNDNVLIPIIPQFTDAKIYTTFVYHNDKFSVTGGTRDEFRLYLNKELDPNRDYFHPEDIVVFERVETDSIIPVYFLFKFSPTDDYYNVLETIIEESAIKGRHAFIDIALNFLPSTVSSDETPVIIPREVLNEVKIQQEEILFADNKQSTEENEIEEVRGAKLFGPDSFRDFVLMAYDYNCAVTGKAISYKNLNNLEAAHIKPKAHLGTFLPCNGIALSRDMHWAFDKGFITISDEFKIIVHDKMKHTILKDIDGQRINVPFDMFFQPEKKFLKYHRENIFGLFLHSGSIRSF
jgi:hypothetical protein